MAHNGREEGYAAFGAGWVSSNMGISKLYTREAVENMGVMLCEMKEERLKQP